jgi:hypothetical protein
MNIGDRGRCQVCGGKIVLIDHPRIIALDVGLWVHESGLRRLVANHPAVGPTS